MEQTRPTVEAQHTRIWTSCWTGSLRNGMIKPSPRPWPAGKASMLSRGWMMQVCCMGLLRLSG